MKLLVRNSRVHGKGVFTQTAIPKGKRIVEYDGERISRKEGLKRDKAQKKKGQFYVFAIDKQWCVDGSKGGIARLINHSCNPNCRYRRMSGRIWIYSLRNIKKGEELTYDYDLAEKGTYACKCGAFNCNGTM
ncbi:MAG TPA: SET domain-containing protein-lysine N-methyltransferase [Candidatus Binatia bacterium]|nr:SET domain-containing protein-lysine N-methyltransferase [Candidatus Binatia bacterium]